MVTVVVEEEEVEEEEEEEEVKTITATKRCTRIGRTHSCSLNIMHHAKTVVCFLLKFRVHSSSMTTHTLLFSTSSTYCMG